MRYVFEEYELDAQRYELRYAGKAVKLEPQVFNVLAYLIQHRAGRAGGSVYALSTLRDWQSRRKESPTWD